MTVEQLYTEMPIIPSAHSIPPGELESVSDDIFTWAGYIQAGIKYAIRKLPIYNFNHVSRPIKDPATSLQFKYDP